jgi:hypothetical protein
MQAFVAHQYWREILELMEKQNVPLHMPGKKIPVLSPQTMTANLYIRKIQT